MGATNRIDRAASYTWAAPGDVNAFLGLMLDNIGNMILLTGLLVGAFGFPADFVLSRMAPGTAVGVLVGDLIYTSMAFSLARRSGRSDVTAMPLGLDTPSTFASALFIIGPAYLHATAEVSRGGMGLEPRAAAEHAWFIGIAMLLASGVFKLCCAIGSDAARRIVPRAGLLGSLAAIALVLISFLPMLDIVASPVAGLVALWIILATLTARWRLPRGVPGSVAAVVLGCLALGIVNLAHWGLNAAGFRPLPVSWTEGGRPNHIIQISLPFPIVQWLSWAPSAWRESLNYLPVAMPLALATVIGGIDCVESAAAAGDEYPTGRIIAVEGFATLVAASFGGVIQSTPYIGHPAYKSMGARAGYTLATGVFVGAAGVMGFFAWIFFLVPKMVVFPILVFVGLEIAAQSFRATPRRHYPAVALACVPALAYLSYMIMDRIFVESGKSFASYRPEIQQWMQTITVLAGGFIVTSLLWGTTLARILDGRMRSAATTCVVAGALALFGVIHSPLRSSPIVSPQRAMELLREDGRLSATAALTPFHWAAAYTAVGLVLLAIGWTGRAPREDPSDEWPE